MSADNGIYILRTADKQHRVLHMQAVDNLYFSYIYTHCDLNSFNSARLLEYYGSCKHTKNFEKALKIANQIKHQVEFVEYGIQIIQSNNTWEQIVEDGIKIIREEIECLKKYNSNLNNYTVIELQEILEYYEKN